MSIIVSSSCFWQLAPGYLGPRVIRRKPIYRVDTVGKGLPAQPPDCVFDSEPYQPPPLCVILLSQCPFLYHSTLTMVRLILFSGSQSPLPVRYARPSKPTLAIPPLVHRALHTALDAQPPSALFDKSADTLVIPNPSAFVKHTSGGDKEYEVTVKIQVSAATPSSYYQTVKDALQVLADRKGLAAADIVLVGLPDGANCGCNAFRSSANVIPSCQLGRLLEVSGGHSQCPAVGYAKHSGANTFEAQRYSGAVCQRAQR